MKQTILLIALLILVLPPVTGAGIGMIRNVIPVEKDRTTTLTFYLTNLADGPVMVDLAIEGPLAQYLTVQSTVSFTRKGDIAAVPLTATFGNKLPKEGGALLVATDRHQTAGNQISTIVRNAVPLRFDFKPKKRTLFGLFEQPDNSIAQQPLITIGDYVVTSPAPRTALSVATLLLIIAALIFGFDLQVFWKRKKHQ